MEEIYTVIQSTGVYPEWFTTTTAPLNLTLNYYTKDEVSFYTDYFSQHI